MARVKLAKNAGFCMGVRRAMDIALEATRKKNGPIYTAGPLIHNPQVLEILEEKGVRTLGEGVDHPELVCPGTMIIRAHGVTPEERQRIKGTGMRILDATCPHVGKVQGIIKRFAREGYATIIIGDRDHAEVTGLLGYAHGKGYVVNTLEEVEKLPALEKICLVAQTTQDRNQFLELAAAVQNRFPEAKVFNTICDSTHLRQEEVAALARRVEAMVVVGGKGSGNTRRLVQISEAAGVPTFHVETEKELDLRALSRHSLIGVTAGASTPNWLIQRVVEGLKGMRAHSGTAVGEHLGRVAAISYLFLALGAGCLTYAGTLLQGLKPRLSFFLVASLYVFSMHVFNRVLDKGSEKFTQPGRTEFYNRYGKWMTLLGLSAAALALILCWREGPLPFILLLAISGLGMVYNMPLFPSRSEKGRFLKLRDIPGSKTVFVALAWGTVSSLIPPLAEGGRLMASTAVAFLYTTILVFIRSTLYDYKDIQGDLMVGKETIPIILGRGRSKILVVALMIFMGGLLALAGPTGWATPLSALLLFSLAYIVLYYWLFRQRIVGWGLLFETVVDGGFIFAGFLAFLWAVL